MHIKLGGPKSLKTECEVTCAKDRRENNLRKGLKSIFIANSQIFSCIKVLGT